MIKKCYLPIKHKIVFFQLNPIGVAKIAKSQVIDVAFSLASNRNLKRVI